MPKQPTVNGTNGTTTRTTTDLDALRDHFAGQALMGLLAGREFYRGINDKVQGVELAAEAYEIADIMLRVRSRRGR